MVKFCLIGAGFIGSVHAKNLAQHPKANLRYVVDIDMQAGFQLAERYGAEFHNDVGEVLADDDLDAVIIATSADTHTQLIKAAARANKAIFCEKPIGTRLDQVDACLASLEGFQRPLQVGFNRRFDPNHRALAEAVKNGDIGKVELLVITSRDPQPPPIDYMHNTPGGLFYDTMCHDFDTARWLLGEEPTEVYATASSMIGPELNPERDPDTAMAILKTASGALCHINVSRRSVYGYDQRIEVFGSKGMLQSGNIQRSTVQRYGADAIRQDPLMHFFIERYREAYVNELDHFIEVVIENGATEIGAIDGRQSLVLSLAALESARTGHPVTFELP
jgi:myo-inositol 2-dehydrogenase/D-chiro-inositol 1-dehydrogenase